MAKSKLEKESANVTKLTEQLRTVETSLKELQSGASKVVEMENERNDLQMKARSLKAELAQVREEHTSQLTQAKEKISAKYQSLEAEYKSYRKEVSVKLT